MQYLVVFKLSTGTVFYTKQCVDLVDCAQYIESISPVLSSASIVETYKLVESTVLK